MFKRIINGGGGGARQKRRERHDFGWIHERGLRAIARTVRFVIVLPCVLTLYSQADQFCGVGNHHHGGGRYEKTVDGENLENGSATAVGSERNWRRRVRWIISECRRPRENRTKRYLLQRRGQIKGTGIGLSFDTYHGMALVRSSFRKQLFNRPNGELAVRRRCASVSSADRVQSGGVSRYHAETDGREIDRCRPTSVS